MWRQVPRQVPEARRPAFRSVCLLPSFRLLLNSLTAKGGRSMDIWAWLYQLIMAILWWLFDPPSPY